MNPTGRGCAWKWHAFAQSCDRSAMCAQRRGASAWRRAAHGSVVVLARPVEEKHASVLAFLADGEAWSSSALALAVGTGQRTGATKRSIRCGSGQKCSPSGTDEPPL